MITREKQEVLNHYNAGLAAYKQRKWDEAIKAFELALRIDPEDGPAAPTWTGRENTGKTRRRRTGTGFS